MNRCYRLVFSRAHNMLVAVEETATASGKAGETRVAAHAPDLSCIRLSLRRLLPAALFALVPMLSFAQIVAGGVHAPNVIQTQNGLDQVNVNRPSGAGVSVNTYNRFDVLSKGAILNNSPTIVQTQQGGMINGNPNFAAGQSAKVIVNQVNSASASQLNGFVETAGNRAEVIIANPSGISVNGGGFINTSRAILTTGTPNYAADGSVSGFNVTGGNITVSGAGLNAANVDQVDLLARAVQANAAIYAKNLNVIAGVRSDLPKIEAYPALPHESPCFRIDTFSLKVPDSLPAATQKKGASALPQDPFAFAREWLDHYQGQCVGKEGIEVLTKGLQQAILSRGYVTTRVLVQPQDLTGGTLTLALVPGIVRKIAFADPSMWGTWKTAYPTSRGDVLNLRDLEQGLEQMKRVSSQDVSMEIRPTDVPGESDVVLTVKRSKPWTFVASVDNSGTESTGKWQGNISLGLNNPLGLNDILSLGANQDLSFGNKALGSHGFNGSYSVPWGYWTATLSGNTNTYYQNIAGVNQTFVSSGNSQTAALRIARVISRSQNDVLSGYVQLSKRFGDSFIDDTTIPTQARNNTFLELGATDRHYFGTAQFDGTLAYRQGIGGFGATADPYPDGPTYRFHMAVLDANLSVPFAVAGQQFAYVGTVHGQFTNDTLFYIDDLTIGSRYTVRGFDGETMLAAERGFYWRNELQWPVFQTGQTLYAGIDYGRVFGPNTAVLVGTQLAGAVIGIRGGLPAKFVGVSYDLFAGTPIYKPEGFSTARWTVGFQLTAAF